MLCCGTGRIESIFLGFLKFYKQQLWLIVNVVWRQLTSLVLQWILLLFFITLEQKYKRNTFGISPIFVR